MYPWSCFAECNEATDTKVQPEKTHHKKQNHCMTGLQTKQEDIFIYWNY